MWFGEFVDNPHFGLRLGYYEKSYIGDTFCVSFFSIFIVQTQ